MKKWSDTRRKFRCEVYVKGKMYGVGKAGKQDAEKRAAEVALRKVGLV